MADNTIISDVIASIEEDHADEAVSMLEEQVETIPVSNSDEVTVSEYYARWSDNYKRTKRIAGKTLEEWYRLFHIDLSPLRVEDVAMIDYTKVANVLADAGQALSIAYSYYRSAITKYNGAMVNATTAYLTAYEEILTNEESPIRNLTKEKVKMIAESRNKHNVIMAMYAKEEKEFFEAIIASLQSVIRVANQVMKVRQLAFNEINASS